MKKSMKELANNYSEIWKDIPGYEHLYKISNMGRIKSLYNYKRNGTNILVPKLKKGYYQIGLRKDKKRKWFHIHRLVAITFLSNPNNYKYVNHKDENKLNNCVNNLEWCSMSYNNTYGTRIERVISKTGKKVYQYDLNNNFIKSYNNLKEAATENNIKSRGNITSCCNGKYKQAGGYIWKFQEVI